MARKKKAVSLEDQLSNYVFACDEKELLVKYKYHKRSFRYNALRNIKDDKPLSMNDQKYMEWLNKKPQSYYTANLQMESEIPERILDMVAIITVYHKPADVAKADYELFVSRVLCYIAKEMVDRYFYNKLPIVDDWMSPEWLAKIDLVAMFNDAVNDFIYYEDRGYKHWEWNPELQHMPELKAKWFTQTSRAFRYRLKRIGTNFIESFGENCSNGFTEDVVAGDKNYAKLISELLDSRLKKKGSEL